MWQMKTKYHYAHELSCKLQPAIIITNTIGTPDAEGTRTRATENTRPNPEERTAP